MAKTSSTSHARRAFAERIAERPLLLDGAMGTLLFSRGTPQRASLDELVLSRPDVVGAVHREYIAAGADIIETDSFTANRPHLARLGLGERTAQINRRAAQLAREAREVSAREVLVAGSIGPISSPLHGPGHVSPEAAAEAVTEQLEALLEGGIDIVQLETSSDLAHLLASVEAARRLSDLPIVASMTFGDDLSVADGSDAIAVAVALHAAGVDVIGSNCGSGPIAGIDLLAQMAPAAGGTPLLIMPNAGLSGRVGGEFVWAAAPSYFAEEIAGFLAAGARLIGGCCGTTPEHVAAMRGALDVERARGASTPADTPQPPTLTAPRPRSAGDDRGAFTPEAPPPTGLAQKLAEGRFVISVEIDPPRSVRIERTLDSAQLIRDAGADLVNISDSAMARVRMGAMAVGFAIRRELISRHSSTSRRAIATSWPSSRSCWVRTRWASATSWP